MFIEHRNLTDTFFEYGAEGNRAMMRTFQFSSLFIGNFPLVVKLRRDIFNLKAQVKQRASKYVSPS